MANKNVNEMPYSMRRKICDILDVGQQWKLLGVFIVYNLIILFGTTVIVILNDIY